MGVRCNRLLMLQDFDLIEENKSDLHDHLVIRLCKCTEHNALVDTILVANLHVIVTMCSKAARDVVKDERTGKNRPVKIGLAPVQRDGLEYEFTCALELSVDGHITTASKDRTGIFDGQYFVPGSVTGLDSQGMAERRQA